jgi:predicted nucleotide-binding protein
MEKLSIPSIDVLTEVITGDNKISPYRTWERLENLFQYLNIQVGSDITQASRGKYTRAILHSLDLEKIIMIINEILDSRYYGEEYELNKTVEILRDTLKKDKLEIIQRGDTFKCRRLNQQGLNDDKRQIQVFNKVESQNVTEANKEQKKVFIVHGHDKAMLDEVKQFVNSLKNLKLIVLQEQSEGGSITIIEKLVREAEGVDFAIVLYSPDDEGKSKKTTDANLKGRARQNVVLEHGYFLGKLGRTQVVSIHKNSDALEIPSDLHGLIYHSFESDWRASLLKELRNVGLA